MYYGLAHHEEYPTAMQLYENYLLKNDGYICVWKYIRYNASCTLRRTHIMLITNKGLCIIIQL